MFPVGVIFVLFYSDLLAKFGKIKPQTLFVLVARVKGF